MSDDYVVPCELTPDSLPKEVINDIAMGVCKFAAAYMKARRIQPHWTAGAFAMNLDAVFGLAMANEHDEASIAVRAQSKLEVFVPKLYSMKPTVSIRRDTGRCMLHICFEPITLPPECW